MNKLRAGFVQMYKDFPNNKDVSPTHYRLILKYFNRLLRESVHNGNAYKLPFGVGDIGIKESKRKKSFDFNHYAKTGEKKYLLNFHSDRIVFAPKMSPKRSTLYFPGDLRTLYVFRFCRGFNRDLASKIKAGYNSDIISLYND